MTADREYYLENIQQASYALACIGQVLSSIAVTPQAQKPDWYTSDIEGGLHSALVVLAGTINSDTEALKALDQQPPTKDRQPPKAGTH